MPQLLQKAGVKLMQLGEAFGIPNLDPESGRIFITGGTGVLGHRVTTRLLQAGYPNVRVGAKHPDELAEKNKSGAEVADFAWDQEETYATALRGVKTVLCTVPYQKHWEVHFPAFVVACEKAGVKHIVKISFYHARKRGDVFRKVPLVRAHGACDEILIKHLTPHVVESPVLRTTVSCPSMSYTILYASHFMSNPFSFQLNELRDREDLSTIFGASGNHKVNYVSPNDVAEVAVRVMLAPREHYNKEYTLTGPKPITDRQVAALLSTHLQKPVFYVDQCVEDFADEMKFCGTPRWMLRDIVSLERIKASGKEARPSFISHDIELICNHKPESFESYLLRTDTMTPDEMGVPDELKPLKTP
jgi:uncharacterized protein YbjT (DUF2867 family)